MVVAFDDDARRDAAQVPFFLVFVDHDGRGVGQFVAGQAEQLFADDLARQEAVAAVGQRIGIVQPGLLRQIGFDDAEQAVDIVRLAGRQRHELGKGMALLHALQPGRDVGAAVYGVELVGDQEDRPIGRGERQHLGIVQAEASGLDHEQQHVDIADHAVHGAVQGAVQRRVVAGLEAGRVDEDELRRAARADAGDAVARRLRLVRGDADLLADECIEQGRLADVRAADDGHHAAARRRGGRVGGRIVVGHRQERSALPGLSLAFSASSMRRAASCSAMRRDRPSPDSARPSAGTAHSTSKVCACAWPRVATMR